MAKFVAVRYVIDLGRPQEQTSEFANNGNLWTATAVEGAPLVNSLNLGLLIPRSVGAHVVDVYWVFSGMHCDGLGDVIAPYLDGNCLQAGENALGTLHFTVASGAAGGLHARLRLVVMGRRIRVVRLASIGRTTRPASG